MKFTLASAVILLASTAAAVPGKPTTTKKPTTTPAPPPKSTSTTSIPVAKATSDPEAPNPWVSKHGLVDTPCSSLSSAGKLTCNIADLEAFTTNPNPLNYTPRPAAMTSYGWSMGQMNNRWGGLGKYWGCSNTLPNTWQITYCGMGDANKGGIKISTYVSDIHFAISCYDIDQLLECGYRECVSADGQWTMGGWDLSYADHTVTRLVKFEKPMPEDAAQCTGCGLWGDSQCA